MYNVLELYLKQTLHACMLLCGISDLPVRLRPTVRPIITSNYRDAGTVEWNHIRRTVSRSDRLRGNQYHIHQLADKHESERAELHQPDGRIAQIESVHTEHAQKHGQQQRRIKVVAIPMESTQHQ